ncbi:c-type cytochrome [Pseudomonas shirazensis]
MKRINQILFSSIALIILLVGVILYQIRTYTPPTYSVCATPVPFFGTQSLNLTENATKGKEIFNSTCAACHKLDARFTGPALRNIDSLVFVKWMIEKNHKIDSTKIDKLGIDYHRTMFKDFVNEENLALIIDYCSTKRY